MFKAIANMAGVLVVLCFIIFLAGVVVNKNRVTKDEAAEKAKEAIARASSAGAEFFRDTIIPTGSDAEPEPAPMPVITDPVAKALVGDRATMGAAAVTPPDRELIKRLLEQVESSQPKSRQAAAKPIPAPKPVATELARPAHVRPARAQVRPAVRRVAHGPPLPATYVVRPGDTLYRIAVSHYGDGKMWKRIAKANGISNPSKISIGAKLVLPPRPVTSASAR